MRETQAQGEEHKLKACSGYYKKFPPQSMNVTLKKVESNDSKGGQTRTHSLLASKSFKAGDVIYKVCGGCV